MSGAALGLSIVTAIVIGAILAIVGAILLLIFESRFFAFLAFFGIGITALGALTMVVLILAGLWMQALA